MAMFGDNGCLLDRCFEQLQLETNEYFQLGVRVDITLMESNIIEHLARARIRFGSSFARIVRLWTLKQRPTVCAYSWAGLYY